MHVAVFGAGGIGAYFGGRLAAAAVDVTLIARGAQLDAIKSRGLSIQSIAGDAHVDDIAATDDPSEVGIVDLLLMTTKTWQLPEAARAARPMVGPRTLVIGLQNGVEAAQVLGSVLGHDRVAGGLCRLISFVSAPGVVRHVGSNPTIVLGEIDGRISDRCERARDVLAGAHGVTVRVSERIKEELWTKFLFITAMGGVGAATRAPIGVSRKVPETRGMLIEAMREVARVARARGVEIEPEAVDRAMEFVDSLPEEATSSMQRDLMEGRRSELDALSGTVVRHGAEADVATPVHRALYAALLPLELRARGDLDW
jgi:2-dehydropantoate 2-reductase